MTYIYTCTCIYKAHNLSSMDEEWITYSSVYEGVKYLKLCHMFCGHKIMLICHHKLVTFVKHIHYAYFV